MAVVVEGFGGEPDDGEGVGTAAVGGHKDEIVSGGPDSVEGAFYDSMVKDLIGGLLRRWWSGGCGGGGGGGAGGDIGGGKGEKAGG